MLAKYTVNYFLNRSVLHLRISKVLGFLMFRDTLITLYEVIVRQIYDYHS